MAVKRICCILTIILSILSAQKERRFAYELFSSMSKEIKADAGKDIQAPPSTTILLDASRSNPKKGIHSYEWSFEEDIIFQNDYTFNETDSVILYEFNQDTVGITDTGQTQAQPVFDPETGEKISSGMRFDPETGEAIIEMRFDPETGEQVAVAEEKQKMSYGEIVVQAKGAANSRHNRATYNAAGVASCFIYPVGLPVAILYTESGIASNMNPYDPVYIDLNPSQKIQYKHAYKQEEKQLRRKSIYGAEGFCVGLFFFAILMDEGI
jgi:hypothetical protein